MDDEVPFVHLTNNHQHFTNNAKKMKQRGCMLPIYKPYSGEIIPNHSLHLALFFIKCFLKKGPQIFRHTRKSTQLSRVDIYLIVATLISHKNILTFQKLASALCVCDVVAVVGDQTQGSVNTGKVFYH